jgi:hypothetical protein
MYFLAALCMLQQLPAQELPVPAKDPAPPVEASVPTASRLRLQFEFGGGHGFSFGKMYAASPGVVTVIGAPTRFQNYGTFQEAHVEVYVFEVDLSLRIGEFFRVGVRASNPLPYSGLFDKPAELLARVSFEAPPGIPLRYDGAHLSVVPVLWLGTGYAVADLASTPGVVLAPGFGPGRQWGARVSLEARVRSGGGGLPGAVELDPGCRWRVRVGAGAVLLAGLQ